MSSIVVAGDTSGSITLQAPGVAGSAVLTLPAVSGTVLTTATGQTLTAPVLGTPASGNLSNCTGVQYTGFKNRIINGGMVLDQRNAGASVSVIAGTTKRSLDMFSADIGGGIDGVFSMQQSTVVPTTGYKNSLALTVTTANTNSGSGRYYRFYTAIEGLNMADCNAGTSGAATVTLSFWVRSSVVGTYCVGVQNVTYNRSYATNYTIISANTWEQKTVTFTLDTSGVWANDNTACLKLFWDLGSGSVFQQAANSWAASNTWATSSQTNWINTAGATLYITGVQLEKGSTATSFDYRPYGTELALCQRYYEKSYDQAIKPGSVSHAGSAWSYVMVSTGQINDLAITLQFKVGKRATPTMTFYNPYTGSVGYIGNVTGDITANIQFAGQHNCSVYGAANHSNAQLRVHYTAESEL